VTYRTILVHIDAGERCPARIDVAIGLAREYDAHLVGLNALQLIQLPGYLVAGAGGVSVVDLQKRWTEDQAAEAKTAFAKAVTAAGFENFEWRPTEFDAIDAVTLHARYADLVVLGQPHAADSSGVGGGFAEQVVLGAGRPVLMVPYAGSFATIGKRILVAWNASRESTRAVTDAIPFLRQAEEVQVIVINPKSGDHGAMPGNDIGLYLSRHGVRVEVRTDYAADIDVGSELLSRAADFGADLVVMGAYGHSRLKELIMGGATRTTIDSMTVPALLSH